MPAKPRRKTMKGRDNSRYVSSKDEIIEIETTDTGESSMGEIKSDRHTDNEAYVMIIDNAEANEIKSINQHEESSKEETETQQKDANRTTDKIPHHINKVQKRAWPKKIKRSKNTWKKWKNGKQITTLTSEIMSLKDTDINMITQITNKEQQICCKLISASGCNI